MIDLSDCIINPTDKRLLLCDNCPHRETEWYPATPYGDEEWEEYCNAGMSDEFFEECRQDPDYGCPIREYEEQKAKAEKKC